MGEIFISYSRLDSDFVDTLVRDLAQNGFDTWMDRTGIGGGERWRPAIVQAISQCDAFILVLSPQCTGSDNVAKELSLADSHKRRIIPLRYQDSDIPPQMQYQLADLQWVDFVSKSYADGLNELVRAIRSATGAPTPPREVKSAAPAPPQPPAPFAPLVPPIQTQTLFQILPGAWQIEINSPATGLGGQFNLRMFPNGMFQGQITSQLGVSVAEGQWQVALPNQLGMQGQQTNGFQVMPYVAAVQFSRITPNELVGASAVGELVHWRRVG